MKEYAEYKNTGLYWYEKAPINWMFQKAKYIFNKETRPLKSGYETVTCFRDGEVTLRKNRRTTGFTESLQENGYQGVMPGDLVIHVMDAFAGASGVSDSEGKCTPVYNICTPKVKGINNYYYAYFLRFMAWSGYIVSLSKGIRERSTEFRFDVFGNQFLPIPPISEQNAIVEYLDKKTKQIDEFVNAKEKEIAALKELKKTLVADAVTKGISNEELVDTELYWYSKKPKSWNLKRAKYIYKKENRSVKSNYETVTCFRDGEVTLRKNRRTTGFTESLQENGYQGVMHGDLVIHIMDAFAGSIGVSDSEGKCTPVYSVCTPKIPNINNYFYAYFLRYMALSGYIVSLSKGIRERSSDFRFEIFANQILPVPPLSEQNAIVEFLDKKTVDIDTMLSSTQKQIDLVKELRTKLIADVVTGKIDVREVS